MTKSCFVSIASYRDIELSDTIDSVVNNSTINLHISVVEQCHKNEALDYSRWRSDRVKITVNWMRPGAAKGAGYARKLALAEFQNEDYFFQIDSHTMLVQRWDQKLTNELLMAQILAGQEKVVLSQFPAGYEIEGGIRKPLIGHSKYPDTPQRQRAMVNKQGYIVAERVDMESEGAPEPSTMLLAGYIFAPGEFATLGYDENIAFWGEEFNLTISAWVKGWRIWSPGQMYVYHHYGRRGLTRVWKDLDKWTLIEYESQEYQARHLSSLDEYTLSKLDANHREVIDKFLKMRGEANKQSYKEQDIFPTHTTTREIVNGRPATYTV